MTTTTFKVLLLGDTGTGKTSLRNQFFFQSFTLSYNATIGANFLTKAISLPPASRPADTADTDADADADVVSNSAKSESVVLSIWDTAGQERFNSLNPTYFRGSDCCLLIYDLTRPHTLDSLGSHYEAYLKVCGRSGIVMIVGNKSDAVVLTDPSSSSSSSDSCSASLVEEERERRRIGEVIGEEFPRFRVSAKSGFGVSELFTLVARRCSDRYNLLQRIEAFEVDESEVDGRQRGGGSSRGTVDLRRRGSLRSAGNGACAC